MRRIAVLLIVLLAEGVWAWQIGGTIGVDKFPISQMVQRGMSIDQELGMEYQGPEYGFSYGLKANRPWRNFLLSLKLEKLDHGKNTINWHGSTPGMEINYQGTTSFPAWSLSAALAYPLTKLGDWDLALQSGLSLLWSSVWLKRRGSYMILDQEVVSITHGATNGWGLGSTNSLVLTKEFGSWHLAVETGYRLAHVRTRGTAYEEIEGEEDSASEPRELKMDVDYDGPFLHLGLVYRR